MMKARAKSKPEMLLKKLLILSLLYFGYGNCDSAKRFLEVNGTVIGNQTFTRTDGPYLVTSDLVVAHNATLTLEAGTEVFFIPAAGFRVHGSLYAKGTSSQRIHFSAVSCNKTIYCNSTNQTDIYSPGIRLVDGTSYSNGRLELQWNGQWGTICNRYWDYRDTEVACRHLGFLGAKRYYNHPGRGSIWIKNVYCTGKENSLWRCSYAGIGNTGCAHYQDIGIECDTLLPFLMKEVYWKGIYFAPSNSSDDQSSLSLENVDLVNALEAIKAVRKPPELFNVTIKDSGSGLLAEKLESPLKIVDSTISGCKVVGINVTSYGRPVEVQNVTVQNTLYGDGLMYKQIVHVVDFCSVVPENASFPLVINASGGTSCSKIFRAPSGGTLSVHFRLIKGSEFELNITDGSTPNKTMLSRITDEYNGKTIKTASTSVLEVSLSFKDNSRVPTTLEFIILRNQDLPLLFMASNCRFSNNAKFGIALYDLIGQTQISNTVVTGSNVGIHMNGTHGLMSILSLSSLNNKNHGVHIEKVSGTLTLRTVNASKNLGSGIIIEKGTISLLMTDCQAERNNGQGLHISSQVNSTINISNIDLINDGGNGIYLQNFIEDCHVWLLKVSSLKHQQNGALFEKVRTTNFRVTSSNFEGNSINGISADHLLTDKINFLKIATSNNYNSGVVFTWGKSNINIESWSSINNNIDGLSLEYQEGQLTLRDCFLEGNKKNGLKLSDSYQVRLGSFYIQNSSVIESGEYGILINIYYQFEKSFANYSITVLSSTIANNTLGGVYVCPRYCYSYSSYRRRRQVRLSFVGNKVSGNNKYGLYLLSPETYELNGLINNNVFEENVGSALRVASSGNCPFPVNIEILSNIFTKNKGEHVVFIDYTSLPNKRFAIISNNSFMDNRAVETFSNRYLRIKAKAVLTIKEGNFTVKSNLFDNPLFPHEIATLIKDHKRTINATANWWGSLDECKIKQRIFDFEDRVDLAQITYHPFLDSFNNSKWTFYDAVRPFCFVKGNKIGGIVDQKVTLRNNYASYEATGDIIVLSNGTLIIEENVTLEFPLQSLFFVQGEVIIKGSEVKRVKFVPRKPLQDEIRLVDGPGPWDGRLEVWLNNTWMSVCEYAPMSLYTVTCRQLGYESYTSSFRNPSGNETLFLYYVQCVTNDNNNIMHCNRENWLSRSSCSNRVFYVHCRRPYWAGIHLAVTAKQSVIENLDIIYAGFAYREDLRIPGTALRVDLTNHNISGVLVNNSASTGLQIMYPHPYKSTYDIINSTIMNTESDGIRLESPFLNLEKTDVINTKGHGISYYTYWKATVNAHLIKMADPSIKKYVHACSENVTFLDDSGQMYYLIVTTEGIHTCENVVKVPPKYRIGMQLLFYEGGSRFTLRVYSGTNTKSGTPWEVHNLDWKNSQTWISNSSSVLLKSSSYYKYTYKVHFMLHLVKATEIRELKTTDLAIHQSRFISNIAGIYLRGNNLRNVDIQSSVMTGSTNAGLRMEFSREANLNFFVSNCSLRENNYGITINSFSGNISIENTIISNSTYSALKVDSEGKRTLLIINSSMIHGKRNGIEVRGDYAHLKLLVTRSMFGWNEAAVITLYNRLDYTTPGMPLVSIKNSTFLQNRGPVVNILQSSHLTPWLLERNVFKNNTGPSVLTTSPNGHFSPEIFVTKNRFSFNFCQEKGVINIRGSTRKIVVHDNVFEGNTGRLVFVEGAKLSPTTVIASNVFMHNNCSNKGVVEIRRMDNEITMSDNVFETNKGLFIVLLQSVYDVKIGIVKQNLTFFNNSLIDNTEVSSRNMACEVNISGLAENKTITIHQNRFNSHSFSKEICVSILASSHKSIMNMTLNYWGYDNEADIRERIFDGDDDHEVVTVSFIPFINNNGTVVDRQNKTDLGGRISSHVRLESSYSPYTVNSDVIILPQASMTIDPGVEVQFGPGVSMLIVGSLFVRGTVDHPVKFSLLKKTPRQSFKPVRLIGGRYPWLGRLEVFNNETWSAVCLNESGAWGIDNAKVVCEQLGYQSPSSVSQIILPNILHVSSTSVWPFDINCFGNETDINRCPTSLHRQSCNSSYYVTLNCRGGLPWGNIRFLREFESTALPTSRLEHLKIEHCGQKYGKDIAAIEVIQYVPEMNSVSVINCTAGGLKVHFPEKDVYVKKGSFINTGGNGIEIVSTEWNATIDRVNSINNKHGVTLNEPGENNLHGLSLYGQIMLCTPAPRVNFTKGVLFLYFQVPYIEYSNPSVFCHKVIQARRYEALSFKLLDLQKSQFISIYDPFGREIIRSYNMDQLKLLKQGVLLPWNLATVSLSGKYDGKVMLQVKRIGMKDVPCTFERERNACGWQSYPGSIIQGITLSGRKWFITAGDYYRYAGHDHTFSSSIGRYMYHGSRYSSSGYAALMSQPILRDNNTCFLVFYYKLWMTGYASLSVLIKEFSVNASANRSQVKTLWSANHSVTTWKKQMLRLPQIYANYSVIFLGFYHTTSYYSTRYVALDDVQFKSCSPFRQTITHKVMESTFHGNLGHGIRFTSTETKRHAVQIDRCKITNNGPRPTLDKMVEAIHLNATYQVFRIINSYLADNRNGVIYAKLQNDVHSVENTSITLASHIHGNTIERNRGLILLLEGTIGQTSNVNITSNFFSLNMATDVQETAYSVCKMTNVTAVFQGNFLFNNSGLYIVEFDFPGTSVSRLIFLNNTLYRNQGLGVNYGVTVLLNGPSEIHYNVFQNPNNRFQISSTLTGSVITVNASSNWWGESTRSLVVSLIRDKTEDYRLSLTVVFTPFLQLPPQETLSISCPLEWIKRDELCFLYKGGSLTYGEAKEYCENYGGYLVTMTTPKNRKLVQDLRLKESMFGSSVQVPYLWTSRKYITGESDGELQKENGTCSVINIQEQIKDSSCDRLYPFICVRRPVIHCPNACYHNGQCVGAICHCYRGWTGEDCSQFHCPDLHDCSERGECVGPNVCKCYPGFLGRGCTYSYCGKYERCADCVTDPFCGWCDSLHSCLGGFAQGPPKIRCPDWFFYHCYTVGHENYCSNNIQMVDCKQKHCNFQEGRASTESCQKCKDLDKCYKITEDVQCRAWNETRCPGGKIQVDYTDQQRTHNIELAKNVKLVDPNNTVIYSCPLTMDEQEDMSLVFIAPKHLDIQERDILCSPQAGGIMHKIVKTATDGPYKVMSSSPAGLEKVINYADFKEEASVEAIEDESTLEDEPDEEDLQDLFSGNITVNESQIIILPAGFKVYKCLGHTYQLENVVVHSYYLVMDKNISTPEMGDIVVSNASDGFIERVLAVRKTENAYYMETRFQRCNENSRWPKTRLRESEQKISEATFCSGGDNNPGLIVLKTEGGDQQFAVNDSIVGRPSQGFIVKVVKANSNEDFNLIEVISANVNENGTINTEVDVTKIQRHHRRTRRSTEKDRKGTDLANFQRIERHKLVSRAGSWIEARLSISLRLTAFVEIEKKWYSWEIKDASLGLNLQGSVGATMELKVGGELRHSGSVKAMKRKQLGGNKYIRLGAISIPAGIFLELTGRATIAVSGSLYHSVSASAGITIGGECRWSKGSCHETAYQASLGTNWARSKTEVEIGAKIDIIATPKVSIKIPVAPKWMGKLMKSSWFSPLKKLVGKVTKFVDLSLSIFASAPLKVGISVGYPAKDCYGDTPAKLTSYYGISDLIFGVSVGFIGKHFDLPFRTGYSRMKSSSYCICPAPREKFCVATTAGPNTKPSTKPDTDDYKRPDNNIGNKGTASGNSHNGASGVKIPGLPCGKEPCCAGNRKGPGCTQPDLWRPSQGSTCSGNGVPQSTSNCGAACRCSGGWGGPFCDRASATGGGDPHLKTLDGVKYDFFGIGEFWGCKSRHNDFGLQFRLFYYKQASLIGGVAVKAGRSIVTVMTIKAQDSLAPPIVRIDGVLLNVTTAASKPVEINNGTVLLDQKIQFTSDADDNNVVLISLQYESGVTVTLDVRYSHVMKRQYLNVLYSPTAAYKGHTEGLCGFMDNNKTNDFMGPDGTLYNDAVQFGDSWRIKESYSGSGTRDSWSWTSSNFFYEDKMDLSYTDPSFVPVYSLHGIPEYLKEIAASTCKSLGISDDDLKSCIFDVAVTNDTSFTDQESFKRDCPNQCSGKGRCVNATCRCIDGWTGDSCELGACLNCSTAHGKCIKGFCECDLGWEGRSCDKKATCLNVNNCTSPIHGVCKTTDICQCNPGYIARDCSIIPTCHNLSNCSGNGVCVDFDVCKCDKGWTGEKCTQYSCANLDYCSGHGRCVGFYKCACDNGWTGASCALPHCAAVNQCSGKGECVSTNVCRCFPGFVSANCSEVADCNHLSNCSGQGVCVLFKAMNTSCRCYAGFTGPNCSHPTCTAVNNCSTHGACIDANLCKCQIGYNGTDCSNFSCEAVNFCSGNGKCVGYDLCHCNSSWSGPACSIPGCSAVNNCSGQGDCILPDTCACYSSFDGKSCDQKVDKNVASPKFERPFYNATIKENSPAGTIILQVHANDTDLGRNGEVFYSMTSDNSARNMFVIDGQTGKIFNSLLQDFDSMKAVSFNITIVASDNGFPQKSGSTIVQITITDENDNCPIFTEPSFGELHIHVSSINPGDIITNVSAVDLDTGINSNIKYNVSNNDAFSIHAESGVITLKSNPTQVVYKVRVTAEDSGSPPCLTEKFLTVVIGGLTTNRPHTVASSSRPASTITSTESETQSHSSPSEITVPATNEGTSHSYESRPPDTSSRIPEATAASQVNQKYLVIGFSVFGGVLGVLITTLIIIKVACRAKVTPYSSGNHEEQGGDSNLSFELLALPKKT